MRNGRDGRAPQHPTLTELMDRGDTAMADAALLIETLRDNIAAAQRLRKHAWELHEEDQGERLEKFG